MLVVAGVVAGIVLLLAVEDIQIQQVEESAELRAQDLARVIAEGDLPEVLDGDSDGSVAQVVDGAGKVVVASENFRRQRPLIADHLDPGDLEVRTIHDVATEQGEPYLVVSVGFAHEGDNLVIHVATPLEPVRESMRRLLLGLITLGPVLLAVSGAVIWRVVGRALRPVEAMRREVAEISIHDLSRRVDVPDTDDEIAHLAATMNTMLQRMDVAVERQRRFVADAAHELRSPVTAMTAELEVTIQHPRPDAELLPELLDESRRLARIIDSLLLLARWDEDQVEHRHDSVDLDDLVADEISRAAVGSDLRIDSSGVSAGQVLGDAELLRRLIRNLLENAVRHGRSDVRVRLSEDDGSVTLVVDDDGPGIAVAQRSACSSASPASTPPGLGPPGARDSAWPSWPKSSSGIGAPS